VDYQNLEKKVQVMVDDAEKKDKIPCRASYVIFKIPPDSKDIVTESVGYKPASAGAAGGPAERDHFEKVVFPEFVNRIKAIPGKEPRFCVIDVFYCREAGREESKLLVMRWSLDSSPLKLRMVYSSSEGAFKAKLSAAKIYQANDFASLTLKDIIDFLTK
jgi:hypothetical protein